MYPRNHAIAGFLFCLLLFMFNVINITNFTMVGLVIVWLSNILVDVDHYIIYIWQKHDFSLIKAYKFHKNAILKEKKRPPKNYYLCIFHTIEFCILLIIFLIITRSNILMYITIGIAFHIVIDIITATIQGRVHKSTLTLFSLICRMIKYKKEPIQD